MNYKPAYNEYWPAERGPSQITRLGIITFLALLPTLDQYPQRFDVEKC